MKVCLYLANCTVINNKCNSNPCLFSDLSECDLNYCDNLNSQCISNDYISYSSFECLNHIVNERCIPTKLLTLNSD
jgi:hypothetical protein